MAIATRPFCMLGIGSAAKPLSPAVADSLPRPAWPPGHHILDRNVRGEARDACHRAHTMGVKVFIRFQILNANARKVVRAAKQAAKLKHLRQCRELSFKRLDRCGVVRGEFKQEDDLKRASHRGRVNLRVVATNNAVALEALYSTQAGTRREPDPRGQIDIIQTPLAFKDLNNCAI